MPQSTVLFAGPAVHKTMGGPVQKFSKMLELSSLRDIFEPGMTVAVKMHFGEPGNARYIRPIFLVLAVEFIKKCGARPFVTDTTVMYNTERKDFFFYLIFVLCI